MQRYEPCLCGDPECRRCFPGNRYPREQFYDETRADEEREERLRERREARRSKHAER